MEQWSEEKMPEYLHSRCWYIYPGEGESLKYDPICWIWTLKSMLYCQVDLPVLMVTLTSLKHESVQTETYSFANS